MATDERDEIPRQKSDILRQMGSVIASRVAETEPPSSSPTTAARIVGLPTADLLDLAVRGDYAGPAWDELQARLVRRAFPDLQKAIESGAIYLRCARAGVGIQRRMDLQVHPYPRGDRGRSRRGRIAAVRRQGTAGRGLGS